MTSYAWVHEIRPGYEVEYKHRHELIWPEMLEALKDAGISNYNIFRHGLTLFGYFETEDLDATTAVLSENETITRWREFMGPIMKIESDRGTKFPYLLTKQFVMK